jgi:hypothetical protein
LAEACSRLGIKWPLERGGQWEPVNTCVYRFHLL